MPTRPHPRRVALVHDWLVGQRGGEHVLTHLAALYPDAPIYTLVHAPGAVDARLEAHPIITSFVQALPGAPGRFRQYLPLFPKAIESFDVSRYDLVISTSHCVAHGVRTHAAQRHVCFVHTPMRYLYDQMPAYLPVRGRALTRPLATLMTAALRAWDVRTAQTPDVLVANSHFVAQRIYRVWGRTAEVVYPPVDVRFFADAAPRERRGLVYVGALVPYKRAACAIALAQATHMPLTIVGVGPERAKLEAMAGPETTFVGAVDRLQLRDAYAGAQALVFAGEEDFGIVPVEAMAAGCPILALGQGGLAETVVDVDPKDTPEGPQSASCRAATGVLFDAPTVHAMQPALARLLAHAAQGGFAPEVMHRHVAQFAPGAFVERMRGIIDAVCTTG